MLKTIAVLGGDARQCYLAERLMAGGFCVEPYQVPGLPDSRTGLHAALSRAHAAALPMPALTKENWIRAEPRPIPLVSVLESLSPGTLVFGGPFEAAAETFAQYPVALSDYTRSPALAAGNCCILKPSAYAPAARRRPSAAIRAALRSTTAFSAPSPHLFSARSTLPRCVPTV